MNTSGLLYWSSWNLEILVFVEGGKRQNPNKNPQSHSTTENKLNPHMAPGWNRTQATLVGDERSHHCVIPPLRFRFPFTSLYHLRQSK